MKVNELLMNIHNKEFNLERGLQVRKYLPIEVKKTIAQGIIYDCTENDNGAIKVDSVQRYMSYVRFMITTHTNLEYIDDDYDTLCSTEYGDMTLLSAIIECFGADAQECSRILDLMMDDYMQEMSIEYTVARLVYDISGMLSGLAGNINEKISNMKSDLPQGTDMEKLNTFLNTYIK